MSPSSKYEKIMKEKWKNTKEQKDLMLNEKLYQFYSNNQIKIEL